jgi:hypothetical protein
VYFTAASTRLSVCSPHSGRKIIIGSNHTEAYRADRYCNIWAATLIAVAISNHGLISTSSCAASCCIILPQGFVRIRNFGFLANRRRATLLPLCFHLLGSKQQPQAEQNVSSTQDSSDLWHCPKCAGPMKVVELRSPPVVTGRSMKALSPIRILRVSRHGSHFFASPLDSSPLSSSSTTFFTVLLRRNQLLGSRCH